jgi:hypothetical protein
MTTPKKTARSTTTLSTHEEKTAMHPKKKSHPRHEASSPHPKETRAMSTSIQEARVQAPLHPEVATIPAAAAPPTVAASPSAPAGAAAAPAPAPAQSVGPPPATAIIPSVPSNFTPATPGEFRNVVPRQTELAAIPQALTDVSKFAEFDMVFGGIGFTQEEVEQILLMGSLWSAMRVATSAWDKYCVVMEGYAWQAIRALFLRMGKVYLVAVDANPKLVTTYPGLSALLGAKKVIAQKGASTRRLNKDAKAKGEPQNHGVVGKRRQRQAAKAALAAQNAAPTSLAPAQPATAPPASVAATTPPAPAPVAVATPAASAAPVNGALNGAAHS